MKPAKPEKERTPTEARRKLIMTTMNAMELNEMELEQVNGGFDWDDLVNFGKKVTKVVVTVVEKEVDKVVETVKETYETVVDSVKRVVTPSMLNETDSHNEWVMA